MCVLGRGGRGAERGCVGVREGGVFVLEGRLVSTYSIH